MSLSQDLDLILNVVKRADPSFAAVDPATIGDHIDAAQTHASQNAREPFLLSAMRLLALPGNGHTRLIPNDAISVLPFRFVTYGRSVFLTKAAARLTEHAPSRLMAVNGTPVEKIERAAAGLLAGTGQRQRVIGPLLFAWPAALADLGFGSSGQDTKYHLQSADGGTRTVHVAHGDAVPAIDLYPRNEHGQADPLWNFHGFVGYHDFPEKGLALRLPSFFDPSESELIQAIDSAAGRVQAQRNGALVIDLRGNTGGDFLATMPLIDAVTESAERCRFAVLVDKFTFSAAIVFVAILRYRLGRKLTIIGEEMGDGLKFFAEGGLIDLPCSGAVVRYSTALHDWETGSADQTTPADIARQLVPVRRLDIDRVWVSTPFDTTPAETLYRRLVEELA